MESPGVTIVRHAQGAVSKIATKRRRASMTSRGLDGRALRVDTSTDPGAGNEHANVRICHRVAEHHV